MNLNGTFEQCSRFRRVLLLLWCMVIATCLLTPQEQLRRMPEPVHHARMQIDAQMHPGSALSADSLTHAGLFLVLGLLLPLAIPGKWKCFFGGSLFGGLLELMQELTVDGRGFQAMDVLANSIGLAAGMFLMYPVCRGRRHGVNRACANLHLGTNDFSVADPFSN